MIEAMIEFAVTILGGIAIALACGVIGVGVAELRKMDWRL